MPAETIEEAVLAALEFFQRMYKDEGLKDVLLEEVRDKDEKEWEVTIGFSRVVEDAPLLPTLMHPPKYERAYKSLTVNKETGKVEAMTIRKV
jgi:hypothetical protein